MSDVFMIVTLSVILAVWTAAVLRRPGGAFGADPIEAALATWLRLRPHDEPLAEPPARPQSDDAAQPAGA